MACVTARRNAGMTELRSRKGIATSAAGQGNQTAGYIDVACLTSAAGWRRNVRCRAKTIDCFRGNAKECTHRDTAAMAGGATRGEPRVAEGGIVELGTVLNRQGQTGIAAYMTTLTTQGPHWYVCTRRGNDRWRHAGHGIVGRIGGAMALSAVGCGRWRIGMDRRNAWHHRKVCAGMTRGTSRTWVERNVIGGCDADREVAQTGVTIRALSGCRVRAISHIECACRCLRSGLESFERCGGGDRILPHAHPHLVGVVAG